MFERGFRLIVMMLAIVWVMPPSFLSAQITSEIIDAAKKEGEVMFYGAITINSSKVIGDAKLFTDFFLGADSQRVFGDLGEYVFHPEVDHKFKKDVKDDQIVVMRLPSNEELETWSRKFREMFR